ncbi:uncharacterized protein RJT20DRAFT_2860 [Scheffersomyces xylosifermentans]|uniref:uncharacterized protein n=1 Tax=Scheffersomyces xylosifermentans TaxID=1304137 RepID=UPI00315CAEC7
MSSFPTRKSILKNDIEESPVDFERFERESPKKSSEKGTRDSCDVAVHRVQYSRDSLLVILKLPIEVLLELKHAEVRPKPPTVKVKLSAKREKQISEYKALLLKEERESRYSHRQRRGTTSSKIENTAFQAPPEEENVFLERKDDSPRKRKRVSFEF